MEQIKGSSFLSWRLSLAETLAFASTVAILTFWVVNTFQSKDDAKEWKSSIEGRVERIEAEISSLKTSTSQIAVDVSYIRGRLEPKDNK